MLEPPVGAAPRVIYVTPSCHHPLGATMLMEQRLRLLDIAERGDAWIIEDDFDGEYRFLGQPIPATQGADRSDRVIYLGTFAKILFPACELDFMVVPPVLRARHRPGDQHHRPVRTAPPSGSARRFHQ